MAIKNNRIFIVDDDMATRETLTEILSLKGYIAESAHSAEKTIEKIKNWPVDLFLIDLRMPGMGGIELLKKLDIMNNTYEAIMITAYAGMDSAKEAMEYGAFSYIPKPIMYKELAPLMKKALETVKLKKLRVGHEKELEEKVEARTMELDKENKKLKSVESILRESEERYRSLFEQAPMGISVATLDGKVVFTNRKMSEITGGSGKELEKIKISDVYENINDRKKLIDLIKRNGVFNNFPIRLKRVDGSLFDAELSMAKVHIGGQDLLQTICVDVAEQKKAEEALKESEEKYSTLVEQSKDAVIISQDGACVFTNKAVTDITGYTMKDLSGDTFWNFLAPESKERVVNIYKNRMAGKKVPTNYEAVIKHKDGSNRMAEIASDVIHYKGKPAVMGTLRDITERKKAEEILRKRLQFENIISNISNDLISTPLNEINKIITEALQKVGQFAGAVRSSVFIFSDKYTEITNTHEWCVDPKDSQILLIQKVPTETFSYYYKILKKNKTVIINRPNDLPPEAKKERKWSKEYGFRPLLFVPMIHEKALYGTVGFYGKINEEREWPKENIIQLNVLSDILVATMERKKAEEALKESEGKLTTILQKSPIPTAVGDAEGSIVSFNEALVKLIGYKQSEIKDIKEWAIKLYPDKKYRDFVEKNINQALAGQKQECTEFIITCKDGSKKTVDFHTSFFKDGLIIQMIDITERRKAEEMLLESEERYRAIFEDPTSANVYFNAKERVVLVNNKATQVMGKSVEDIIGKHVKDVYPARSDDMYLERVRHAVETGEPAEYTDFIETLDKWFLTRVVPIRDELGKTSGVQASTRDITERKKAEEALRENEKMLSEQNVMLQEKNIALREVMDQLEGEKDRLGKQIGINVDRLLLPLTAKLKSKGSKLDKTYIDLLEENLNELTSQFGGKLSDKMLRLTQKEIEMCNMIKQGLTSKEIAKLLDISHRTVETHRNNIRKKLGIGKQEVNLVTYLKNM